jgi:hypothetical protein
MIRGRSNIRAKQDFLKVCAHFPSDIHDEALRYLIKRSERESNIFRSNLLFDFFSHFRHSSIFHFLECCGSIGTANYEMTNLGLFIGVFTPMYVILFPTEFEKL